MKYYYKFYLIFLILFFASIPSIIFANEVRLDSNKTEVRVGEEFFISVVAHTNEPANAIEGRVVFSSELFDIKEVYEGSSIINFWIETPNKNTPGIIIFSGITPGGFGGANQNIFSFVLRAKKEGTALLNLENINLLSADGNGTKISSKVYPANVLIKSGDSAIREEEIEDMDPPEDFRVFISRDESIFENKYFLVFSTQDKKSGIDHYEIKEGTWSLFSNAESPYLLKNQGLNKRVYIKAIDKEGNNRIVIFEPQNLKTGWREYLYFVIILLIIASSILIKLIWLKSRN
jgi:hypothetical protein